MKRWIWEHEQYPSFTYDRKKLAQLLEDVSKEQGYLIAMMDVMNQDSLTQRQLETLENEAISTSAIEGHYLSRDSVKASIKKQFGFENVDYTKIDMATDYLVEVLIDANSNYKNDLTLERLFGWHNALFPNGYSGLTKINVATFRGEEPMEIVSGYAGKEKTFYVAPTRERLEEEMEQFLQWFNDTETSLIKASIAHLWFVIIHPFEDGNGRISRAITDLVLSDIESSKISKLYSMSSAINADRKGYYKALESTTGYVHKTDNFLDITIWCEWFLSTLYTALIETKKKLAYIREKTKFWDKYGESNLNSRQVKVLNKILDMGIENFQGDLSKKKYIKIADTTPTTASRDMKELIDLGCIEQIKGTVGKNTRYKIII
ncbi:MAG: Filamentation induced by cAMP protein Fic [uncultured Sulfurovum sp.]|uniref:Filamentation induced by cAMP protein Fic n=1 Tax=uncultured Sulfurovum sp. TaxID=269237 RepID=A0A6S6SFL5_9BACT|nr:MAG: Filamentation induced by cAMP protein Fic [uncultured Sulfurovum sp.]